MAVGHLRGSTDYEGGFGESGVGEGCEGVVDCPAGADEFDGGAIAQADRVGVDDGDPGVAGVIGRGAEERALSGAARPEDQRDGARGDGDYNIMPGDDGPGRGSRVGLFVEEVPEAAGGFGPGACRGWGRLRGDGECDVERRHRSAASNIASTAFICLRTVWKVSRSCSAASRKDRPWSTQAVATRRRVAGQRSRSRVTKA